MEEKLSGIVLSAINYGENDKILSIFTLEKGVVSALIKGVKKAKAKLKFACEPFCFAEFIFNVTTNRRVVIGAGLIDSFYSLREDIVRFYAGATVLEFVRKFEKENIVSPDMFILAVETLKNMAYQKENCLHYLTDFLIKALSMVGFGLDLKGCHKCGEEIMGGVFFDFETGGFYCAECRENFFKEIYFTTYINLKNIQENKYYNQEFLPHSLRLLEYYIYNKTEESIRSLKELNKIIN